MARKPPDHLLEEFIQCVECGMTTKALSDKFRVNDRVIRYWKTWLKNKDNGPNFPEPLGKNYDDYIQIESDKAVIIGDSEIPNHDPEMFELAFKIAQNFDIKTLIINGDFVALDCFSTWAKTAVYKLTFEDELDPALATISEFLKQFDTITWVTGNHEKRLLYKVEGNFSIGKFFEKFGNVSISEYSHCILKSGGKEIRVNHPKNYRRNSTSLVKTLANIHLMNIISGHTHHQSFSYHESGKYWTVDGGHCRNQEKTRYKNIDTSTHPQWNSGFCFVINGEPYLVNKDNADFWLSIKY